MTTVTEAGVSQAPYDVVGGQLSQDNSPDHHSLPGQFLDQSAQLYHDVGLKQSTVPLFSQPLLTVEQLIQISVDPDIQAAVDSFLKGLTNQMFARIVRNGSAEVGQWLGAKVQSERDGWTAMLRMAMNHIEFHRKNALQGQLVIQSTLEQLLMLLDCFQRAEGVKRELEAHGDQVQAIHTCLHLLADCCNALMEDRFRCVELLGCSDTVPEMLSTAVQGLKDRLALLEAEKTSLDKQLGTAEAEASRLRQQNEQFLEEIQNMEEKMKAKQDDLEGLKTQLQEIDKMVKFKKKNTSDKCVGSPVERLCPATKPPASPTPPPSSTCKFKSTDTQTLREPSLIELSEEKLRVLKERARKLESSLHGAIATMDKLRRTAPSREHRHPSTSSSAFNTATFVAIPSHTERKATPKLWMSASFEVTNAASAAVTAPVPKLGHFQPTERRCFSERPAGKGGEEQDGHALPTDKSKGDSRRVSRTRAGQVSKCLRCQKLFTATDNHKLACCFHSKGKERMEVYNDDGQLLKVQYIWKCCHLKGDNDGCCYGHHV